MRFARKLAAATTLLTTSVVALAHDGHGLQGSHWHASDVSGFVVVGVLAALAILLSRGE
jgi:hypothetical protein